jgi:hypothetical protein
MMDVAKMHEEAWKRHQDVLHLIEELSDATGSDRASTVREFNQLSEVNQQSLHR